MTPTKRRHLLKLVYSLLILTLVPATSWGQQPSTAEEKTLTEKLVLDYLDKMADLYTFEKPDIEKLSTYAREHISENAKFSIENHVNELVDPVFEKYNYEQIIKKIGENYVKAYNTQTKYKMESLSVSETGTTAEVKYHVWMSTAYASEEPKTGRKAEIRVKTYSLCNEQVEINETILKVLESNCVQDIIIAKPVFLE